MKGKLSKSQRPMKQSSLFEYASPQKAGPSTKAESTPTKKRRSVATPRKSTQTMFPITPRSFTKQTKSFHISESEDSSEDIGRIKLQKKETTSSSSNNSDSSTSANSSDCDSDEVPRPTQARRLKRLAAFVDEDEGDEAPPMKARNTSSKRRKLRSAESSDESLEDEAAPKRRRLTRARKTSTAKGSDSGDEDVDDLDQEHVLDARLRERGKKSEFQKNLEKMKKRKLGQSISSDSEEAEDEEGGESEEDTKPFKGAKETHGSLFGSDEEDEGSQSDDFIVEDDGKVELPAEFSMETHQDLQHQFKKIFQFFVHIAVQQPHLRKQFMEENLKSQEYFSAPLQIARRKLDGLRDSLVASSVWRLEFTKALRMYPAFSLNQLNFAVNGCDACHLGSRISTFSGHLDGVPYDRMGFQPLNVEVKKKSEKKRKRRRTKRTDSDSESSSDSYSDSDSGKQSLKKEFDLGRFCARRTHVYHNFLHWEYELFSAIEEQLEDVRAQRAKKKNKQFYRVAYAGGRQPPEDLGDADSLTEWLDERGIVDREWQRIRLIMSSARKLEIDGKKGGDLDTS